jgi:AhpD family alkylhydroperoxidase
MRKEKLNYYEVDQNAIKGMKELERYVKGSEIESSLIELVKIRASQINQCAYCIDMHTKDAREAGEEEQRIYGLNAWSETPFYSRREQAALAWTEALTRISENEITDEFFKEIREHFTEQEMVILTTAIVAINGWNRLAIGFGNEAGSYKPDLAK